MVGVIEVFFLRSGIRNESTLVKPAKKERSVAATEEEKITKKMLATLQQMKDRHMRDQMRKQKEHAGLFG